MAKQQKIDAGAEFLKKIRRKNAMYVFGGGTIGGDIWNWRQPTIMERLSGRNELIPELKQQYTGGASPYNPRGLSPMALSQQAEREKIDIVPSNAGQEFWNSAEGRRIKQRGRYVRAPELYRRGKGASQNDSANQFYSTVTGRPMGTLMGTGSYGGFGGGSKERPQPPTPPSPPPQKPPSSGGGPQPAQGPAPKPTPRPKTPPMPTGSYMSDQYGYGFTSQPLGFRGEPAAFTPAGSSIGMRPSPTATSTLPPFPEFDTRDYLGGSGFGGIPRFPYSNY